MKNQMRTALNQPLQEVSDIVLNKIASKGLNSTLSKYKSRGLPKTAN